MGAWGSKNDFNNKINKEEINQVIYIENQKCNISEQKCLLK
jgi:hypothetical protein